MFLECPLLRVKIEQYFCTIITNLILITRKKKIQGDWCPREHTIASRVNAVSPSTRRDGDGVICTWCYFVLRFEWSTWSWKQTTLNPAKVTSSRDTWVGVRAGCVARVCINLPWGLEYLESGCLRSVLAYPLRRLLTRIQHRSSKISRKSEVCGAHWHIDA